MKTDNQTHPLILQMAHESLNKYTVDLEKVAGIASNYSPDIQARINARLHQIAHLPPAALESVALDHFVDLAAFVVYIAAKKEGETK